ncbi:branched-chain amino acid ABC transporter permease [Natrialba swarupiae]|nr:branched-chain amino acid ABC transporter permease [Natrialba swarupiae]
MRAVADDRRGAEMIGVNYERIYMLTFGIGAVLTGISGVLYGMLFTLSPTSGVALTAFAFTIVVVGGVGSFFGTILASLLIGLVDSFTATMVEQVAILRDLCRSVHRTGSPTRGTARW